MSVTILCRNVPSLLRCAISVLSSKKSIGMLLLEIATGLGNSIAKSKSMYLVTCTNVNPLLKYDLSHMYSISALSSPLTNA